MLAKAISITPQSPEASTKWCCTSHERSDRPFKLELHHDHIRPRQPHSAHEIDFEVAQQHAEANESYAAASDFFLAFRGRVRDFVAGSNADENGEKRRRICLASSSTIFVSITVLKIRPNA